MLNNPTTLTKVLNGVQSTLNIANKVMPLYKESKPIISKFTTTYKNLKNNKDSINNLLKLKKVITQEQNTLKKKPLIKQNNYKNINNPTFFI